MRPALRRVVPPTAAACALALALPASAAACPGAHVRPSGATVRIERRAIACLLSAVREQHGLTALGVSGRLARAAAEHSRDMVARHYFGHGSPGGSTMTGRVRAAGYLRGAHAWEVGEALAWATGGASTPAAFVASWLRSPEHRAILLDPAYRQVGVGLALGLPDGERTGATLTADFGVKR